MDEHPELAGYEPIGSDPRRSRRLRVIRVTVYIGLAALVLPLVLSTVSVANAIAGRACEIYARSFDRESTGGRARLELFGPGGPGWQCYAVSEQGHEQLLGNLGLFPSMPRLAPGVGV